MSDTDINKCSICLTTNQDANIIDASSFTQFFIEDLGLKDFNKKMWLCMWCKASMKKAIAVMTLALQSDKTPNDEGDSSDINNTRTLNNIALNHLPHVDIPSLEEDRNIEENDDGGLDDDTDVPIDLERQRESLRIHNQRPIDHEGLKYELIHLSWEEQIRELELHKEKLKHYEFQCELCGAGYFYKDKLAQHMSRHTPHFGRFTCEVCYLQFTFKDDYKKHVQGHNTRYKCNLCSAVFKKWAYCVVHRFKCGGVFCPTGCPECPKVFTDASTLQVHLKIHKGARRFRCEHCDKIFTSKQRLLVHLRTHSGEKPFLCEHCGRGFSTLSIMRAHLSVHSDVSSYYCVKCNAYYKTSKSLKRHFNVSAKHSAERADLYPCKFCTRKFPNQEDMVNHEDSHSVPDFRCEECEKKFSSKSNLNKHVRCIHAPGKSLLKS